MAVDSWRNRRSLGDRSLCQYDLSKVKSTSNQKAEERMIILM
jgi:hypothetical protein